MITSSRHRLCIITHRQLKIALILREKQQEKTHHIFSHNINSFIKQKNCNSHMSTHVVMIFKLKSLENRIQIRSPRSHSNVRMTAYVRVRRNSVRIDYRKKAIRAQWLQTLKWKCSIYYFGLWCDLNSCIFLWFGMNLSEKIGGEGKTLKFIGLNTCQLSVSLLNRQIFEIIYSEFYVIFMIGMG